MVAPLEASLDVVPGSNAFHPRKGKPAERRGRKAVGLEPLGQTHFVSVVHGCQAAEGVGWRRARPSRGAAWRIPGGRLTWSRDCLRAVTSRLASLFFISTNLW